MSKDWEVINTEYAAKLLRKITNIYLEKVQPLISFIVVNKNCGLVLKVVLWCR